MLWQWCVRLPSAGLWRNPSLQPVGERAGRYDVTKPRASTSLMLAVLFLALSAIPASAEDDFPLSGGFFFAERQGPVGRGYAVVDDERAAMWSCFQQMGGIALLGRPLSSRYDATITDEDSLGQEEGHLVVRQAFTHAVAEWSPNRRFCRLAPILSEFTEQGLDPLLRETILLPDPALDVPPPEDGMSAALRDSFASFPYPGRVLAYRETSVARILRTDRLALYEWHGPDAGEPLPDVAAAALGHLAMTHGLVPHEAASAKPPPLPDQIAIAAPRVVVAERAERRPAATAALDGANRVAALLVPRYSLPGPPEVVIRLLSDRETFAREALALPEVRRADAVLASRRCAVKSRDYCTGDYTLLMLAPCGTESEPAHLLRRRAAQWYALIVHDAVGPHWSTLPVWFIEGLAWHEAAEALDETPQDSQASPFALEDLATVEQWQSLLPAAWSAAHAQAIGAVGQLHARYGALAPGTILHWAREVGFERAFAEVTGLTVTEFAGAEADAALSASPLLDDHDAVIP